ncbi:hypothetical protein LBMAG21_01320 [Armatimonadota bacterium]|nr:hypothetical protein LBMAG21_01320 [Armatimonadota bacterium]
MIASLILKALEQFNSSKPLKPSNTGIRLSPFRGEVGEGSQFTLPLVKAYWGMYDFCVQKNCIAMQSGL